MSVKISSKDILLAVLAIFLVVSFLVEHSALTSERAMRRQAESRHDQACLVIAGQQQSIDRLSANPNGTSSTLDRGTTAQRQAFCE